MKGNLKELIIHQHQLFNVESGSVQSCSLGATGTGREGGKEGGKEREGKGRVDLKAKLSLKGKSIRCAKGGLDAGHHSSRVTDQSRDVSRDVVAIEEC